MKLYTDDFVEGMWDMFDLHKQGNNIFEMAGGPLFPHSSSQKTWQLARENGKFHLNDGTNTYSFKGELGDYDSELERLPDTPLPDLFTKKSSGKHRAQVHRSDPGSIYFTLQEGYKNPTYTLRHVGDNKWKAIPKPRKVKDMLKEPLTPHNVNLDSIKEGMLKELEVMRKEAFGEGLDKGLGNAVQDTANAIPNIFMLPGKMTGPVTHYGDPDVNASEPASSILSNAAISGGIGAGAGGLYHLIKRHLLNTKEENQQEDVDGGHLLKRMMIPGAAMAGLNIADRQIFPFAMNNPEVRAFPGI